MKGFEAREIIDDDGNFYGYCDECSGSDPCLRCDRNELRDEARRLRKKIDGPAQARPPVPETHT